MTYEEQVERAVQRHMDLWEDMSDSFLESQSKHWITWHCKAAKRLLLRRSNQKETGP